jgi:5-methyltetrahydrofolate--homocysteine methyltransferase
MPTVIESSEGKLMIGTGHPTAIAGMLINTLKDDVLIAELVHGKLDRVRSLAEKQRLLGVGFLDVMIAHPNINEKELLPKVCLAAHKASGLPLSIDSADVEALQNTLDAYPYKSIINSVNGEKNKIETILPLVKESGSAVIGLCMDEAGMPHTVEEKMRVTQKLVDVIAEYGIEKDDLIIDPLCYSAAVVAPDSMLVTLETLRRIKQQYGMTTFLGTDNAGFGMPQKDYIDLAYAMAAIPVGVDAVLLEPPTTSTLGLEGFTLFFAADFLSGNDLNGKRYLKFIRAHGLHKKTT